MFFPITVFFACFFALSAGADEVLSVRDARIFDVCYGEYGCFTIRPPFGATLQRPIAVFPAAASVVGTKFFLYTRDARRNRTEISRFTTLGPWSSSKATKLLIHGFLERADSQWWIDMKNAILDAEDVNVIIVNWSKGNGFPYEKATANTQVVGAETGLFINYMIANHGAKAADFHVIGHSLGSHIAGYAGKQVVGLGRITGLDPAGPYFENTDPVVRLDPTDAAFVDVIHTDGAHNLLLGLGTLQRMGHVDFYPNGGYDQPKCSKTSGKILNLILQLGTMNIDGFLVTSLCSHLAAVYFFTDSIRNECPYVGYSCDNFDDFTSGKCSLKCDGTTRQCNRMGYWTSSSGGKGDLYLKTQDANAFPYCINHYQITLESGSNYTQTRGLVTVTLVGTVQTITVTFDDDDTTFKRGSVENRFIPLTVDIGDITKVDIEFKKTNNIISSSWYSSTWKFTKATVLNGDNQISRSFCPTEPVITSGSKVRFAAC
jgi:pimeloyl-ACP methyl ester carboxylesterase